MRWPGRKRKMTAPRTVDVDLPAIWPKDRQAGFVRGGNNRWYFCRPGEAPRLIDRPPHHLRRTFL